MNEFEGVVPILNVKNVPASMDYYVNKLGFSKKWDWGNPPTFACVVRDKVNIFSVREHRGGPARGCPFLSTMWTRFTKITKKPAQSFACRRPICPGEHAK